MGPQKCRYITFSRTDGQNNFIDILKDYKENRNWTDTHLTTDCPPPTQMHNLFG